MKLWILSDLHREFSKFRDAVPQPFPEHDVVVLAGDIDQPPAHAMKWMRETFGDSPIIYVAGNHEFYGGVMLDDLKMAREAAERFSIHFLENDEIVLDGTRFLGCTLWTDFALFGTPEISRSQVRYGMNDFSQIAYAMEKGDRDVGYMPTRFQPIHALRRHQASRAWLEERLATPHEGPTVVVTHHAPHRNSVAQRFASDAITPGFVSHLPELFQFDIDLWVHGHTHDGFDYEVNGTRVMANPKGYGGENPAFDWCRVVDLNGPEKIFDDANPRKAGDRDIAPG